MEVDACSGDQGRRHPFLILSMSAWTFTKGKKRRKESRNPRNVEKETDTLRKKQTPPCSLRKKCPTPVL